MIFDVKRFAIHDGPGIRTTVFFKGCPLSCLWCHNPESQARAREIILRPKRCIKDCTECLDVCREDALSKTKDILFEREKCNLCGECERVCPSEAIRVVGRKVTVEELLGEIDRDSIFYDESGGGVTFSGGEPLMQPEFLSSMLEACAARDIHTTVDTCGYAPFQVIEDILNNVDRFTYDIKIMDEHCHREYTGASNALILDNLGRLSKIHGSIEIRIPLIPGITDGEGNMSAIVDFLSCLGSIDEVALLPYHASGNEKYEGLSKENKLKGISPPAQERMESIENRLKDNGFKVRIGG